MTTPRRSIKSMIMFGAVAVTASAGLMIPSAAHAATYGDLPVRFERACLRIPNLQIRTDNLITRLGGDAATKGSLAWLQAQIDDAKAKNRPQLVTVLQNRLAVRTQSLEVLKQRQQGLAKLAQTCVDHGVNV